MHNYTKDHFYLDEESKSFDSATTRHYGYSSYMVTGGNHCREDGHRKIVNQNKKWGQFYLVLLIMEHPLHAFHTKWLNGS